MNLIQVRVPRKGELIEEELLERTIIGSVIILPGARVESKVAFTEDAVFVPAALELDQYWTFKVSRLDAPSVWVIQKNTGPNWVWEVTGEPQLSP